MKSRRRFFWAGLFLLMIGLGITALYVAEPEYIYTPSSGKIANPEDRSPVKMQANSADAVDPSAIDLGRKMFYEETFGNEVFFSDIMGVFDGAFTIPNIAKAVIKLNGQGTNNLRVEAAETVTIADKTIKKGDLIDTGLDVPKGAYAPLGVKVKFADGKLKAGISCVVCHATVDREGKIVQGVPNSDINIGLMLAMGTNTAAYFTHTEISNIAEYIKNIDRTVVTSDGKNAVLPDPVALEKAVDEQIMQWPRGGTDTTIDFKNNPVQIPDAFTLGDHPYGWSGLGVIGPFKGLSAMINNVHGQNTDPLSQTEISSVILGMDKEVYLGTILQNAATPKYRYVPGSGMKPTEFFASVDPTPGVPGVNQLIPAPAFPKTSFMTSTGLFSSGPGYNAWEQINAMSAWMNTLVPPDPEKKADAQTIELGTAVFKRAGCVSCHAGDFYTNNRIIPIAVIGTEPTRAKSFKKTENWFAPPVIYTKDTPVPLPPGAKTTTVPASKEELEQVKLAWAHGDTSGGYKVPSLFGLNWSAPYLHDGGVAVGADSESQIGIPGTLSRGIPADPANSLRALIDKQLRLKVIAANKAADDLQKTHVQGIGHDFWVDETAGFNREEQDALIRYLLSIKSK